VDAPEATLASTIAKEAAWAEESVAYLQGLMGRDLYPLTDFLFDV
jgi:hypothetical protein